MKWPVELGFLSKPAEPSCGSVSPWEGGVLLVVPSAPEKCVQAPGERRP